ncbi:SET domain-containing protein [Epithele typhae]|uniref:SET domain-containing protein n=1 Tax=Epithele typhae TaxID=378194 RepID=UPI0020084E25|nr:SET domain-containing protein [Epithele typhae]KAH9941306.1 SET domain-containing protein [Epithele typhae]
MSFGSLKSARKAKESQSFVTKPQNVSISADLPASSAPSMQIAATDVANFAGPSDTNGVRKKSSGSASTQNQMQVDTSTETSPSPGPPDLHRTTKPVSLGGLYSELPSTMEVRESVRSGRGVYTKSAVTAGTTIMTAIPSVYALSTSVIDQYCSACAKPTSEQGRKRCMRCKTASYCNAECQNRDWISHKNECTALRKWAEGAPSHELAIPADAVRVLGRALWTMRREGFDSVWLLRKDRASLQPSEFETHTHLAHSVVRYLGVSSPQELEPYGLTSAGDLVDLISRFTTNTFTLTTPSLAPIGICVSPSVALINHSCEPNAVMVFPNASATPIANPQIHIVVIKGIPATKEIRISYVDTTQPTRLRQTELKAVYNFTCRCKNCSATETVDPREALWCPNGCGGMCPHPDEDSRISRCAKCGTAVKDIDAVLDALRIGQQALDKAIGLQSRDAPQAQRLTTNVIPLLLSAGLTPSAHPLLALTRTHQELLTLSTMPCASRRGTARGAGAAPTGHPVRTLALAELGKLLASLVRAHEEARIGFGRDADGGQVGMELREAAVRLEKELGTWTTGVRNALRDAAAGRAGGSQ